MSHLHYILSKVRPYRRRLAIGIVALLGVTLLGVIHPLIIATIIDRVIDQKQYELLAPLAILLLAMPWVSGVLEMVGNYLVALLGQRLVFDIRLDLYRRVHRLSCQFMQTTTTGKLMERLRGDVAQLQGLLTNQTIMLAVQLIYGLGMLGVMLFISVKLTVLVLLAVGLYVANYKWFVKRIRKVQRRYRRKMDVLSGRAQERLAGALLVKSFHGERQEGRDFAKDNFKAERVYHRYRMLNAVYGIGSSAVSWGIYVTVLLLGLRFAIMGELTYGLLTAFLAYTMRLLDPALKLADLSAQIQQAKVSLDRIFELMRAEPDSIYRTGLRLPQLRGEVAFENVCFFYERGNVVLHHVNMHIKPGMTVALVGETGCGKTTIAKLLYRYYEPQAGHLTIDGHDISTLDTRWYRHHLALVPQDPIVFDTTISANIAYGRPSAPRDQIDRAARLAELGDLIDRLDQGLDTRLGDYGEKLSVGEKQRMCIARAILADPVILILDEATSSLDSHSESLIQLALRRVMANRTSFVIAHRLSTIINADMIVVMDHGRIIEMGNHAQLMHRKSGRYRQLYVKQMALTDKAGIA